MIFWSFWDAPSFPCRRQKNRTQLTDPMSTTETMQLYYDRPTSNGKTIHLDEPIPDGGFDHFPSFSSIIIIWRREEGLANLIMFAFLGFISKKIFNAAPITNIENPSRPGPIKECESRKLYSGWKVKLQTGNYGLFWCSRLWTRWEESTSCPVKISTASTDQWQTSWNRTLETC